MVTQSAQQETTIQSCLHVQATEARKLEGDLQRHVTELRDRLNEGLLAKKQ